ncbi:hypothetical protein [Paracoccus sp. SY]|uniref:hypothetical protein n=1 Tax=Paracoccus sp. SY TaxID=1330255 RepID=UPI000CCFD483|nr:hypothetical protein [Paracoccus sp. SY]
MAQLGNLKDKNADRVRRAAMLKKAQALTLPDPMIGYPKEARQGAPAPQSGAGENPLLKKAPKAAPQDDVPAAEAPQSNDHAAEPAAVVVSEAAEQKLAPAPDQAPSTQATKPQGDEARNSHLTSEQADNQDLILHRVIFQFTQDHHARAEAIAERLGFSPDAVLKKAAKMTAATTSDFVERGETVRTGPTFRHPVSFPEGAAKAWIKKQDPLGYYTHPRTMLRAVGRAAFDRAAETLLKQLEKNNR